MRAVLQRVHAATVRVEGRPEQSIGPGLLVFLGIAAEDGPEDAAWLQKKILNVRLFEDAEGRMNQSVLEIGGGLMLISQFTLFGTLRKGTRPSFHRAAPPELAKKLYEHFLQDLQKQLPTPPATGVFGAHMDIEAHNDGPVTLILDSRQRDL
jgi:D-aminoacyl-tRNA deacylase